MMRAFFTEGHNVEIIRDLLKQLTVLQPVEQAVIAADAKLKDKIVVFTGELSTMTREGRQGPRGGTGGAKVTDPVSKKTSLVVGRRERRLEGLQGGRGWASRP